MTNDTASPQEARAIFNRTPEVMTFPARNPSLPHREYHLGDDVAINEVVIRHVDTGVMLVVYPGSRERAKWCWPDWVQVYVG